MSFNASGLATRWLSLQSKSAFAFSACWRPANRLPSRGRPTS